MTLKELFDQGGCQVGNLVILEGGQHFLIGDATPFHAPSTTDAGRGWDGWLNTKVVFVDTILDPRILKILELLKDKASIECGAPETPVSV